MKKFFGLGVALALLLSSVVSVSAWEYIFADDAYSMLQQPNTYLVDVRTPYEWYWAGHPGDDGTDGAFLEGKVINIPFWLWGLDPVTSQYTWIQRPYMFFVEEVVRQFDVNDTLIIMCKTDGRGGYAAGALEDPLPIFERLQELGFYNLYDLGGGFLSPGKTHNDITYIGWVDSGLPYNNNLAGIWQEPQGLVKADIFFDWLEFAYMDFLCPSPLPIQLGEETQQIAGIFYRYYASTGIYIAVVEDDFYYYDESVGLQNVGT
ncbi:MAG: rhodanese-like domain-containing protein, partial [Deltaproteobacteria bacterium]|nr:rhodanese-like domain-containing protein [Deltaproteobacteria bacterium]